MAIESTKFEHIGENLCSLLETGANSQRLLRLIAYNTDDPFSIETLDRNGNLMQQPDINFDDLLYSQIIIGLVDTTMVKDLQTKIFLHPHRGRFPIQNATSEETFILDIVFPHIYHVLRHQGNTRPELIASEFFKNIDRINIDGAGIQKIYVTEYIESPLDIQNFGCLSCLFLVSNSNLDDVEDE